MLLSDLSLQMTSMQADLVPAVSEFKAIQLEKWPILFRQANMHNGYYFELYSI